MKSPAFQFYTKDWKQNLKLRRCSEAARGAWIDLMCVLHESEEYGVVRFKLAELVKVAGAKLKSVRELIEKGVLKGGDSEVPAYVHTPRSAGKALPAVTLLEQSTGPMWYSSRMVRDEWLRGRRGESTRFSTDHQPPHNPRQGQPPSGTPTGGKVVDKNPPSRGSSERLGDGASSASAVAVPVSTASTVLDTSQPDQATAKAVESSTPKPTENLGRILEECHRARIDGASESNPLVARWAERATVAQVTIALAEARRSVPFPKTLGLAYIDPIIERIVEEDRKARQHAEQRVERTQEAIAEQRKAAERTAPMPDHLRPKRHAAAA